MKVSYSWLKDYVEFEYSPDELAHKLTMVGLEVESVESLHNDYAALKIAEITAVSENSVTVYDGSAVREISASVPGAQVGWHVALRPDNALATGKTLFGHEDNTVVPFPGTEPGKTVADYLPEQDTLYDLFITPNRPDCLGVLGIAREISALTGNPVRFPQPQVRESDEKTRDAIAVTIDDPTGCPRYSARVVKDLQIAPSPYWMQYRLYSVGIRAINNVVDVTNYVLMEFGHPLHAFDYSLVIQHQIHVRRAKEGERFMTLDGKGHTLDSDILLICDGVRPVALAGIMGGLNSEVKETTRDILLECAYFDPVTIRKGAKKLGIATESSARFERGVDPNATPVVINRTAELIQQTAGGKVLKGIVDAYPKKIEPKSIVLPNNQISRLLGAPIDPNESQRILEHLGLNVSFHDEKFDVLVPTFRPDLTRPVDLIEEIARIYGYDRIEEKKRLEIVYSDQLNRREMFVNLVRNLFVGQGFKEILTNSMIPQKDATLKFFASDAVRLLNPISEDMAVLRPSLVSGLIRVAQRNIFRQLPDFRLFEIGRIFRKSEENERPLENLYLGGILSGSARPQHWLRKTRPVDFYDLKGYIEYFFHELGLYDIRFVEKAHWAFSHPSVQVMWKESPVGTLGRIHEDLKEHFDVSNDLFAFEVNLDFLEGLVEWKRLYTPIPKFPTVRRDLALMIDLTMPVGVLLDAIRQWGGQYLKSVGVFDVYTGKPVPPDKKSVAVRLEYVPEDHTFTEEEISEMQASLLKRLKTEIGAALRPA